MTFLLGCLIYVVVSLVVGMILTIVTWQPSGPRLELTDVIAFFGCTLCFAMVWPFMAMAVVCES